MTDRGLIEQFVREGSNAAFSRLVERHTGLVYSTCKRDLGDSALAEECTQAVFLILARKAKWLRGYNSLAGWLFKTARLAARDTLKQELRRRKREGVIMEQLQSQTEREGAAWRLIEPELNDALGAMPSADRELILMRFFEQYSHAEIAESVGIKEDAARIRVSRAVDRLRGRLLPKIGVGAGLVAGVAFADLLGSRSVEAAAVEITARISLINHVSASGTSGAAAISPRAAAIAQGALRTMSRTTTLRWTSVAGIVAGAIIVALTPQIAHALLAPQATVKETAPVATAPSKDTGPFVSGYKEIYRFRRDGQDFGTQSASITAATAGGQTWSFNLNLQTPVNGQTVTVQEDGNVSFGATGHPTLITLTAMVGGSNQVVTYDFTKQPPTLNGTVNGQSLALTLPFQPSQYLVIGNNITCMSVAFRSIPRPAGKDIMMPFLSADGPVAGMMTWSSMGNDTLTIDGNKVSCTIYDLTDMRIDNASPLAQQATQTQIGQRIWLDSSGSIVKLTLQKQHVEITRE